MENASTLPILAITMGDPASIGPELCLRTASDAEIYRHCRPLFIGDRSILERSLKIPGIPQVKINSVEKPLEGVYHTGTLDVLDMHLCTSQEVPAGQLSAKAGDCAFRYVEKAIQLAMEGKVDGTVTNALNKEAMNLAGHHFSGHTEIYAKMTGTKDYAMMLIYENMRISHVSTHVSLREACDRTKCGRILQVIRLTDAACRDMGIQNPRIAVSGLNPHCGEGGLFGKEEIEEISPAVHLACDEGMSVTGPVPPDTVFAKLRCGLFDAAVAMYHDQGHIPLKLLGFFYNQEKGKWESVSGVNITLGLPIIRTSVDHGTAFDIAGKGIASSESLKNAVIAACDLSFAKKNRESSGKAKE